MGRPPSIQWYYKQWLGDNKVLAMDWDARGMHFHLLMMSIQEQPAGSIPDDVALIRRWLWLPSGQAEPDRVWARVQSQIFAAWTLRNGRWFNSGMEETMKRADNYRTRYETGTKNSPNPKKIEEEVDSVFKRKEDHQIAKKIAEPYLEKIYQSYPKHEAKGPAFKAIAAALQRILKGEDSPPGTCSSMDDAVVYLIQRASLYARYRQGQDKQYTPLPASWFNAKRYLDDEAEWVNGQDRGNHQSQPAKPHITAQHQRYAGNILAVGAKYGLRPNGAMAAAAGSAGVGDSADRNGSGQAARPAGTNPGIVLEGEVKGVS